MGGLNKWFEGELDDKVVAGAKEKAEPTLTPHFRTTKSEKTLVRMAEDEPKKPKCKMSTAQVLLFP